LIDHVFSQLTTWTYTNF